MLVYFLMHIHTHTKPRVAHQVSCWITVCLMLCDRLFLGDATHSLLTPDAEPSTDQIYLWPKSNLVNQWALLELLTGIWMKGYLQEQKSLKDSWITKAQPNMADSSQSWGHEHTVEHPGSSVGRRVLSKCLCCSQPHPGSCAVCSFQAARLVPTSSAAGLI